MYPRVIEEIYQLRSDLHEKLLTRPHTQMPKTLYHYTDAAGLLGIVRFGKVWATNSAYLNDASELQYAVGLMEGVVLEATKDAKPDSWKDLCRGAVLQLDSESRDSLSDGPQYFVACFSEDGDRLSQWRGYGKSIGGYALGFPFDHPHAIEKRINDSQVGKTCDESNPKITVGFNRCWYDPEKQKELLAKAFGRVLRRLEEGKVPVINPDADLIIKQLGHPHHWLPRVLKWIPQMFSPYFKDPAFEDEREWRLVVTVQHSEGSSQDGHDRERTQDDIRMDEIATVRFRSGEYSLVPYIELPVALDAALSLSRVVVGPTPLPENARAAAMQLLRPKPKWSRTPISAPGDRKIVCEGKNIVSSKIPFRRV